MRAAGCLLGGLLLVLLGLPGCKRCETDEMRLRVTVTGLPETADQLQATVHSGGTLLATKTYPQEPLGPGAQDHTTSLRILFGRRDVTLQVSVTLSARDGQGAELARGSGDVAVEPHGCNETTIALVSVGHDAGPDGAKDGGPDHDAGPRPWVVTPYAGQKGIGASLDGPLVTARFCLPHALARASNGDLFVSEWGDEDSLCSTGKGNRLRRIRPAANAVDTIVSFLGNPATTQISGVALDPANEGTVYFANLHQHKIMKTSAIPSSAVLWVTGDSQDLSCNGGAGPVGTFNHPRGIAFDSTKKKVFVADEECHRIRSLDISSPQMVSTFAGTGVSGAQDGDATLVARFDKPGAAAVFGSTVYVADTANHCIREIRSGKVSTTAGACEQSGYADGTALGQARFNGPNGVAVDSSGVVYVSDTLNHCVRSIAQGTVSTLAGTCGTDQAELKRPNGIVVVENTTGVTLYVADSHNHRIVTISQLP